MRKCYRVGSVAATRARRGRPQDATDSHPPKTAADFAYMRRQVAHHEAGHCVAAAALGQSFYSIQLDADGGGTFHHSAPGTRELTSDEVPHAAARICPGWKRNIAEARRDIIQGLAGPAASFAFDGIWFGDSTDRAVAKSLATTITDSKQEQSRILRECQCEALALVRREWTAVTVLANRLLASPTSQLDRDQIARVLRVYSLIPNQMQVWAKGEMIGEVFVSRDRAEAVQLRNGRTRSVGRFKDALVAARAIPAL